MMTTIELEPANSADINVGPFDRHDPAEPRDPVLRQAGILHGLPEEAVDSLIAAMSVIAVDRGTVLFEQNEPGEYLYIVISGKVKLSRHSRHMEKLIAMLGPGDQFGELSLLDPGPRNSTATVVAHARLARLDKASLDRWIMHRPDVALRLLHVLARRLRRTTSELADTILIDVPGRIAKQLLDLARRFGVRDHDGIYLELDLSQTELAQLVGSSRETVNKTLADFAGRGWLRVVAPRRILILDAAHLAGCAR
jgi:CRP-like cAMP-binding protein